jgi:hypothetical protein
VGHHIQACRQNFAPRDYGGGLGTEIAPHHKWVETPIGFDAFDCPKSMAGTGHLPLLVSPTISNIKLYHVLVDGGAALNLISVAVFKSCRYRWGSSSHHARSQEWA